MATVVLADDDVVLREGLASLLESWSPRGASRIRSTR
jgi:YesN/AraC family two-component response regulator